MKNGSELVLTILQCYVRRGACLSTKELCAKTGAPRETIKRVLEVLERRGYVSRAAGGDEYTLNSKVAMLT